MGCRLYILISGYQIIDKQKLIATAARDEKMDIPIPYYLADFGEEKVLIDTGIADESGGLSKIHGVSEETNPVNALARLGIKPDQITHIIHTHLHFDHAANTKLFKNAKVIVQLEELRAAYFPGPGYKHGYVEKDIRDPAINWYPIVGTKSMFSNELLIVPTPGHTPGHQSVLIKLSNHKPVLIAGDVAPLADNVEKEIRPGVATDPYAALYSIQSLKAVASFFDAEIWYGHDPEFYSNCRVAPECYL